MDTCEYGEHGALHFTATTWRPSERIAGEAAAAHYMAPCPDFLLCGVIVGDQAVIPFYGCSGVATTNRKNPALCCCVTVITSVAVAGCVHKSNKMYWMATGSQRLAERRFYITIAVQSKLGLGTHSLRVRSPHVLFFPYSRHCVRSVCVCVRLNIWLCMCMWVRVALLARVLPTLQKQTHR